MYICEVRRLSPQSCLFMAQRLPCFAQIINRRTRNCTYFRYGCNSGLCDHPPNGPIYIRAIIERLPTRAIKTGIRHVCRAKEVTLSPFLILYPPRCCSILIPPSNRGLPRSGIKSCVLSLFASTMVGHRSLILELITSLAKLHQLFAPLGFRIRSCAYSFATNAKGFLFAGAEIWLSVNSY